MGLRIKAAVVASGRQMQEVKPLLADALQTSGRNVDRIVAGERALSNEQLTIVADTLRVPEWFLRFGFEGAPVTRPDEVAELARMASRLSDRIEQLQAPRAEAAPSQAADEAS